MYNETTTDYLSNSERDHRSEFGQFFTPYTLVDKTLEYLVPFIKNKKYSVLEPSVGTGQFKDKMEKIFAKSKISYCEIDEELAEKISGCLCGDFLLREFKDKFDFIIGNPPYFEMNVSIKKKYTSDLMTGRYNIYALFIERCIDLLKIDGILAFVIPNSLNSAPSFEKLRRYIHKTCSILMIDTLGNFSNDVAQDVMIFICQRTLHPNKDYIISIDDTILFSIEYKKYDIEGFQCLEEYGTVTTGTIVWNEHTDKLIDEPTDTSYRLVYSDDIPYLFTLEERKERKRNANKRYYIETDKPSLTLPVILITRSKIPQIYLVEKYDSPLIAENHVNVITGSLDKLKIIYNSLTSDRCKDYIATISNTLNLSKTQLSKMPIFKDDFVLEIVQNLTREWIWKPITPSWLDESLDIYCEDKKIAIERKKNSKKEKLCNKNGIKVLYVSVESSYEEIENYLMEGIQECCNVLFLISKKVL